MRNGRLRGLTLFHTADSNVGVFEEAARAIGLDIAMNHVVRADLLTRAQDAGELTAEIAADARAAMAALVGSQTQLLCTCSTIGPAADDLVGEGLSVQRVDRALAEASFAAGGDAAVIVAVPTTLPPTREVFDEAARRAGGTFSLHLVDNAWPHFCDGNLSQYYRVLADAILPLQARYPVIALAQASMAPVALRPGWTSRVLSSPAVSLGTMAIARR